jgi:Ca2+/Na+ antiporter
VSTVTQAAEKEVAGGRSTGRVIGAIVLAVIGIIAVVAAIMYFTTPAHSLPSVLGAIAYNGHNHTRAYSHRTLRGVVSIIVGVILLVGAWFAYAWKAKEN